MGIRDDGGLENFKYLKIVFSLNISIFRCYSQNSIVIQGKNWESWDFLNQTCSISVVQSKDNMKDHLNDHIFQPSKAIHLKE